LVRQHGRALAPAEAVLLVAAASVAVILAGRLALPAWRQLSPLEALVLAAEAPVQ